MLNTIFFIKLIKKIINVILNLITSIRLSGRRFSFSRCSIFKRKMSYLFLELSLKYDRIILEIKTQENLFMKKIIYILFTALLLTGCNEKRADQQEMITVANNRIQGTDICFSYVDTKTSDSLYHIATRLTKCREKVTIIDMAEEKSVLIDGHKIVEYSFFKNKEKSTGIYYFAKTNGCKFIRPNHKPVYIDCSVPIEDALKIM